MADGTTVPRSYRLDWPGVRRLVASVLSDCVGSTSCSGTSLRVDKQKAANVSARRGPLLFAFTSHLSSVELQARRVVV